MLETLANFGEFIAAIGVIISLVYLALQVRHSTNMARVEAHQAFTQSFFATIGELAKDEALHRIYRRGMWEGEALDEYEKDRLGMVLYQMFVAYSSVHQAAKIDPELVELSQSGWSVLLASPFAREWWKRHRVNFAGSFREMIDQEIIKVEKNENGSDTVAT